MRRENGKQRNYLNIGVQRPHYTLSELTGRFLKTMNGAKQLEMHRIEQAWPEIVGAAIASKSKVIFLKEGVLSVQVSHSTVLGVLQCTEKPRLLRNLQKRFPKINIRDISFRIG
ncbi:hypothetical protein COB21_05400 [Candidatus Aerophobetes bacterium]|uniref:DUF721 domain-containing protein n=1 Tax=Aerophobetes bacterium TaxID=2030807 RepID=A0A2A4WZ16_UNCAE|nr:MAG: hypothetical protein COB21_05400 [Candidatus Aerophobetes bacterium]